MLGRPAYLEEDHCFSELFKRKAGVLKNIDHPFIPACVDFFELGKDEDVSFVLVQE